jgi:hypothetical protein
MPSDKTDNMGATNHWYVPQLPVMVWVYARTRARPKSVSFVLKASSTRRFPLCPTSEHPARPATTTQP